MYMKVSSFWFCKFKIPKKDSLGKKKKKSFFWTFWKSRARWQAKKWWRQEGKLIRSLPSPPSPKPSSQQKRKRKQKSANEHDNEQKTPWVHFIHNLPWLHLDACLKLVQRAQENHMKAWERKKFENHQCLSNVLKQKWESNVLEKHKKKPNKKEKQCAWKMKILKTKWNGTGTRFMWKIWSSSNSQSILEPNPEFSSRFFFNNYTKRAIPTQFQ
jgi:hypothetical protein